MLLEDAPSYLPGDRQRVWIKELSCITPLGMHKNRSHGISKHAVFKDLY